MYFEHKDIWSVRGDGFMIQVSRHHAEPCSVTGRGENRWAVYAYLYPQHELFSKCREDGDIYSAPEMPLHGGCSFFQVHKAAGKIPLSTIVSENGVTSYQIGCDYDHLNDGLFSFCATPEEAPEVFRDAEALFHFLSNSNSIARRAASTGAVEALESQAPKATAKRTVTGFHTDRIQETSAPRFGLPQEGRPKV